MRFHVARMAGVTIALAAIASKAREAAACSASVLSTTAHPARVDINPSEVPP